MKEKKTIIAEIVFDRDTDTIEDSLGFEDDTGQSTLPEAVNAMVEKMRERKTLDAVGGIIDLLAEGEVEFRLVIALAALELVRGLNDNTAVALIRAAMENLRGIRADIKTLQAGDEPEEADGE